MAEKDLAAIQEMKETIIELKGTIDKFISNVDLRFQMFEKDLKVANHRILDLENTITWLWRVIAGGLLTGAIAFLYK
ncbi:MAG: hemolysin XhlA family protein [Filifactoraceae bacterium]